MADGAHGIVWTGKAGEVRWAFYLAAQVGAWRLEMGPTGGTVTAQVVSWDPGRIEQPGLTFVVPGPSGFWRWPIRSVTCTETTLTAQLGLME